MEKKQSSRMAWYIVFPGSRSQVRERLGSLGKGERRKNRRFEPIKTLEGAMNEARAFLQAFQLKHSWSPASFELICEEIITTTFEVDLRAK